MWYRNTSLFEVFSRSLRILVKQKHTYKPSPPKLALNMSLAPLAIRQQRFQQAIAGNFDQDTGTIYYSNQSDIDATVEFTHHNQRPPVSARQATRELIEQNDPRRPRSPHEQFIIQNLRRAVFEARSGFWHPDLIIKCFWDLDTIFFGGVLRGNVRIAWQDGGDFVVVFGQQRIFLARTLPLRGGRADIFLNATRIILNPPAGLDPLEGLFESTLHEVRFSPAPLRALPWNIV